MQFFATANIVLILKTAQVLTKELLYLTPMEARPGNYPFRRNLKTFCV
jgi:hypothetical protein